MKNPDKKMSPVGHVKPKGKTKAAALGGKKPIKDGMASDKLDKKMSKVKPGDAKPSYKGLPGKDLDKMKATGATAKFRKKLSK